MITDSQVTLFWRKGVEPWVSSKRDILIASNKEEFGKVNNVLSYL